MSAVCSFCGHGTVPESIRPSLSAAVTEMITVNGVTQFYLGNHGQFDSMVLSELNQAKIKYPHIRFSVVLAYMPGKREEFASVSEMDTVYPEGLETVPRRFAISYRNRWMVDHSDYMVAYVNHDFGGAVQTLHYAEKRKLKIVNIAAFCD